jgi:hypothetical protein
MSALNTIFGVRIFTDKVISTKTDIGLYSTIAGNSEFRFSESPMLGVGETWTPGLISSDIDINQGGDYRVGGGIVQLDDIRVNLINTTQFSLKIQELGINLNGLKCEVIEFVGTDEDADSVSRTVIFTGTCEDSNWSSTFSFIVKSSMWAKRRSDLGSKIKESEQATTDVVGDQVPITFGKYLPEYTDNNQIRVPRLANAIRSKDALIALKNTDIYDYDYNPVTDFFCIIDKVAINGLYIKYRILLAGTIISASFAEQSPVDTLYLSVVAGDRKGQIRRIDKWQLDQGYLYVTVNAIFEDGDLAITGADRSWVKILKSFGEYKLDSWPCIGPLDPVGDATDTAQIFVYQDDRYQRIPSYACSVSSSTSKNELELFNDFISNDINTIPGYILLPLKDIKWQDSGTLSLFGYADFTKIENGLYKSNYETPALVVDGSINSIVDQTLTNKISFHTNDICGEYHKIAIGFKLPSIPAEYEFEKVYIGIWLKTDSTVKTEIVLRRYYGNTIQSFVQNPPDAVSGHPQFIRSLPDFYFSDDPATKNKYFLQKNDMVNGTWDGVAGRMTSGYKLNTANHKFELPFSSKDEYNSIIEGVLLFNSTVQTYVTCELSEICVIFEKASNVKDSVFLVSSGRTFNDLWDNNVLGIYQYTALDKDLQEPPEVVQDFSVFLVSSPGAGVWANQGNKIAQWDGATWHFTTPTIGYAIHVADENLYYYWSGSAWAVTRKNSGALIESPLDVMEHALRLGNWSELGITKDWGHEYSPGALIKTSGDGSFDDATLADPKAVRVARQITDEGNAWNDSVVKSICNDFYLVSYQDETGKECVSYLQELTYPATVITLGEIIGDIGDMIEPSISDVFVEPKLRYAYDIGSQKYLGVIDITRVAETAWNSAFTPGLLDVDGEPLWNKCHALWLKYRQMEPCDSSLMDQRWIYRYEDAVWKLNCMVDWMDKKRTSFSVSYGIGKSWHVGTHIKIRLPHQTADIAVEVVIERVKKKKNKNSVDVQVIILTAIPTAFFFE